MSSLRIDHLQLIWRIFRKRRKTHHRSLHRSSFTLFQHFPASASPHSTQDGDDTGVSAPGAGRAPTAWCPAAAACCPALPGCALGMCTALCRCAACRALLLLWRKLGKATAPRPTLQQATLQRSSAESSSTLPQIWSCGATRI